MFVDYLQTAEAKGDEGKEEINSFLREHPYDAGIWFAGLFSVHTGIASMLSPELRTNFQMLFIGITATNTYRNYKAGVKISIPFNNE